MHCQRLNSDRSTPTAAADEARLAVEVEVKVCGSSRWRKAHRGVVRRDAGGTHPLCGTNKWHTDQWASGQKAGHLFLPQRATDESTISAATASATNARSVADLPLTLSSWPHRRQPETAADAVSKGPTAAPILPLTLQVPAGPLLFRLPDVIWRPRRPETLMRGCSPAAAVARREQSRQVGSS